MRTANMTATALAFAAFGAASSLFAEHVMFGAAQQGQPVVIFSGGGESTLPLQPQVAQILSGINNGSPAALPQRQEAAEQKLVDLGSESADLLHRQIGSVHGPAREVLIIAAFRLENAPLSPRQSIGEWASKKAGVDPAAVVLHYFSAEDLRHLFPHHLFYVAEKKADASDKNALAPTLVALAADGKVQSLNDDAALGHFLKIELSQTVGKLEPRRAAAAAAELALARQRLPAGEIFSDAKLTDAGVAATAHSTAANTPSVSVAVKFSKDAKVASVTTTIIPPSKSSTPATEATAPRPNPAASEPATPEPPATAQAPASGPAGRFRRRPPPIPGGFQPYHGNEILRH